MATCFTTSAATWLSLISFVFFSIVSPVMAEESLTQAPASTEAPASADQKSDQKYLPIWNIVTDIPETAWDGLKVSFSQEAIPTWALVISSTVVLYHYDEDILEDVQAKGRTWGLGNSVDYKQVLNIGKLNLWSAPVDTAGWLYFMGDGTIPIVMSAGMIGVGYAGSNSHLYNTGVEMADGLLTGSIFDQVVKHIAGRQSPSQSTENRGAWHPLPNWKEYSANTSGFDAFSSGHIMTATVMFTVLEQEYPEYNSFLYPFEVAWLGVLGFGMVNVGVHWASDYPLGIAMGYVFGKTAVDIHKPKTDGKTASWRFFPGVDPYTGTNTMNALYTF